MQGLHTRLAAVLVTASVLMAGAAAGTDDPYAQQVEQWRDQREARLSKADGWLSLVGLSWLREGENSFGTASSNDLVLDVAGAPERIGVFTRSGKSVRFVPAPGAKVTGGDGVPFAGGALATDAAAEPTVLHAGRVSFYVISRGEALGVRVKDPDSPARRNFHGLSYFPVDPAWRVVARFVPHPEPKQVPVPTVLGTVETISSPGYVVFEHGGQRLRLDALADDAADGLFFAFGDRTNGRMTYGGGRFLYADAPRDGEVELDFNKSYNPPCAFSEFATCPLPPPGNRLKVAVEAGEKKYGDH